MPIQIKYVLGWKAQSSLEAMASGNGTENKKLSI
jgi:hypothetical protein